MLPPVATMGPLASVCGVKKTVWIYLIVNTIAGSCGLTGKYTLLRRCSGLSMLFGLLETRSYMPGSQFRSAGAMQSPTISENEKTYSIEIGRTMAYYLGLCSRMFPQARQARSPRDLYFAQTAQDADKHMFLRGRLVGGTEGQILR